MNRYRRWIHIIVPLAILIVAIGARREFTEVIEEAQLKVFDVYQRIQPREYQPAPVRFVDLDDETLEKVGQWPWPRTYLADFVARLANAGAAVIAFDIVFAEEDRTSPTNVLPLWPSSPEMEALIANKEALPDHDAVFADVLSQINAVSGYVLTQESNEKKPEYKVAWALNGDDPRPLLRPFNGAVTNLPIIQKAVAGSGSFTLIPEKDSIIRRIPLVFRYGDSLSTNMSLDLLPSLSSEVLRVVQGAKTNIIRSSNAQYAGAYGEQTGLSDIKIGRMIVPTDSEGRLWLHYTDDVPERTIPAWKLFTDNFDNSLVEGMVVIIGTSAQGLGDLRATPLNPVMPGALVHVQALEQIFLEYFLDRPDWSFGAEIIYLVVLGLLLIFLLRRLGALWCAIIGVAGIAAAIWFSWYMFTDFRLLLDPIYPSFVVLLIYLSGSLINYLRTEAEKRQVRGAFSQYLSPALVEQLADEPDRLALGGEMRDMTLLFADIRGFTTVSEQFKGDPQGLTHLINRFLTPMTNMILDRRGTIDKYMGDCIMAFWNAPLDDEDHADHACDSALSMFSALEDLNADIKAEREAAGELFFPLNIGIGLNSGEACVGNMGSDLRFDYSVLGDTVNLAARLEGQSKNYGVGIVIGDQTAQAAPQYASLELDLIAVKGKEEAVHIFCLLGDSELKNQAEFQTLQAKHEKMIETYRSQKWEEARSLMAECRVLDDFLVNPLDVLYDMYEERISDYVENPPAEDWDGVFVATSK